MPRTKLDIKLDLLAAGNRTVDLIWKRASVAGIEASKDVTARYRAELLAVITSG